MIINIKNNILFLNIRCYPMQLLFCPPHILLRGNYLLPVKIKNYEFLQKNLTDIKIKYLKPFFKIQ